MKLFGVEALQEVDLPGVDLDELVALEAVVDMEGLLLIPWLE